MDRYRRGEWFFESLQGPSTSTVSVNIYPNSFISIQNHKAGISFEFHTYEAIELITPEIQQSLLYSSGSLLPNHVSFAKPAEENSCCSSYKGRVKPIRMHALINLQRSSESIPFQKLGANEPILWFSEVLLFDKNTGNEKAEFKVKIRAMPTCFYVLARMSLYSSRDFVRSLETRIFHEYDTGAVLRNFAVKKIK